MRGDKVHKIWVRLWVITQFNNKDAGRPRVARIYWFWFARAAHHYLWLGTARLLIYPLRSVERETLRCEQLPAFEALLQLIISAWRQVCGWNWYYRALSLNGFKMLLPCISKYTAPEPHQLSVTAQRPAFCRYVISPQAWKWLKSILYIYLANRGKEEVRYVDKVESNW